MMKSLVRNVNRARFQLSSDSSGFVDACGPNFMQGTSLVGVDVDALPLNIIGGHVLWDSGATSTATANEVRSMRAGNGVAVRAISGPRTGVTLDALCTEDRVVFLVRGRGGARLQSFSTI